MDVVAGKDITLVTLCEDECIVSSSKDFLVECHVYCAREILKEALDWAQENLKSCKVYYVGDALFVVTVSMSDAIGLKLKWI